MSYTTDVKKKLDAALAEMDALLNVLDIVKSGAYNVATEENTQIFSSLLNATGVTVQPLDYIQIVNDTDTTLNGFWINNSDDAQVIDSDITDPTSNLIKVSDYIGSFNLTTFITNFKTLHGDVNSDDLVDVSDVREFYKGATGIQGEQGLQGLIGNTGIDGLTGDQGVTGATGATPVQFITIVQTYVDGTFTYTVNALYPATQIVTLEVLKNGVIDFTAVVLNPGRLAHSFDYSPLSQSDNGAAITTAIAFSNASVSHSTLPSGTVAHPQDNPVTATVSYNADLSNIDIVLNTVATEDITFDIVEVVSGTNWSDTYPALTVTIPKGSLLGTIMQDVEGILLNAVNATTELQILNRYVALTDLTLVGNAGMFIDVAVNVDYTSTFNSDPGQSSQYDLSFKTTLLNSVPSVTTVSVVYNGLTLQKLKLDQIQPGDTVSDITFTDAELAVLQGETLSILISSDDSNITYNITPNGSSNASYTVPITAVGFNTYNNSLGAIAQYDFNESSGNFLDNNSSNPISNTSGSIDYLQGSLFPANSNDNSAILHNVDSTLSIPITNGNNEYALVAVVNATGGHYSGILKIDNNEGQKASFKIYDPNTRLQAHGSSSVTGGSATTIYTLDGSDLVLGVISRADKSIEFYVNGVRLSTVTRIYWGTITTLTVDVGFVSGDPSSSAHPSLDISSLTIFDTAISQTEMGNIYDEYLVDEGTPAVSTPITFFDYVNSLSPTAYIRVGETAAEILGNEVANDSSGNNTHGTYVGSALTLEQPSLLINDTDTSVNLNGDSYIRTNATMPNVVSVHCLVKIDTLSSTYGLITKGTGSFDKELLYYDSAVQKFSMLKKTTGTISTNVQSDVTVQSGQVYQLIMQYDGVNTVLYVDGILQSQVATESLFTQDTLDWHIGAIRGSMGFNSELDGVIDEIIFFDTVLTAQEVTELYTLARIPATSAPTTYPDYVNSLSPTAYYRLGESSGTVATDSSDNANHGTHVGSPTLGATGLLVNDSDAAVEFDGSNKHISLPDMGLTGSSITTIVGLFKVGTNNSGYGTIIDFATQCGGRRIDLLYGVSIVTMNVYNNAIICSHVLNVDETYHFAVVFDPVAGQAEIFINGQSVSSGVMGDTTPYGNTFAIGAHTQNDYYAKGTLDEVAIFNTTLTEEQILKLYALSRINSADYLSYNALINTSNPLAYYRMNETSGNVAVDETGNNNNGTYEGTPILNQTSLIASDTTGKSVKFHGNGTRILNNTMSQTYWNTAGTVVLNFVVDAFVDALGRIFTIGYENTNEMLSLHRKDSTGQLIIGYFGNGVINFDVTVGQNHHCVITKNGTTVKVYLDGVLVGSTTSWPGLITHNRIYIGDSHNDTLPSFGDRLDNNIDEFALFDTALTDTQIKALYVASKIDLTTL